MPATVVKGGPYRFQQEWPRANRACPGGGKIASAIRRRIKGVRPELEIKVTVADALALKPPGGIDFTEPAKAGWGWVVEQIPGKRYRKLLTRAIIADNEYVELNRRVETVWKAPGLSS